MIPYGALPISDYELVRVIGRGAYGEVWLTRNLTGSFVALKIVRRAAFDHDRPFEREFEGIERFEPISRSDPSQVAILHAGRGDGYFYYVMELADDATGAGEKGRKWEGGKTEIPPAHFPTCSPANYVPLTLKRLLLDRGSLPANECITIALSLTRALAHLHGHELVHRDVKPSNVIFVGGMAKLADIGLVTSVDATRSFVMGTEGYLPSEGAGTPQADLYSLGKVLYEMSTGCDRKQFPALPPDIATRPDRDALTELNAIVVRACQLDPHERYANAEAMKADLALLQTGKSVKAHHFRQQSLRAARKIGVAVAAVILASLVVLFTVHPHQDRLSKDPLAKMEYQEGLQCLRRLNKEGVAQALEHFNRAIARDPKFTMAYDGLFEVYVGGELLGLSGAEQWAKMRASASKLLELDSKLAEAQAAQAWVDFLDWKWDRAEPRFREAIKLNPKCAIAHMRYGFCLVHAGRPDDGHKELLIADSFDPQPRIKKNIGHVFYVKRQFRSAIEQYEKALGLEPNFPNPHYFIGCAYRALGNYTKALDEFEEYDVALGKDRTEAQKSFAALRAAYASGGPQGYWSKCLVDAQEGGDLRGQARCQANLHHYDQALVLLEEFFATNQPESLEFLLFDECWDPVHSDPRFKALLDKIGFTKVRPP